jgi:hypothetical protein
LPDRRHFAGGSLKFKEASHRPAFFFLLVLYPGLSTGLITPIPKTRFFNSNFSPGWDFSPNKFTKAPSRWV